MTRFTHENTEGFDDADLTLFNNKYQHECERLGLPLFSDDIGVASVLDHIAESILVGAIDADERAP